MSQKPTEVMSDAESVPEQMVVRRAKRDQLLEQGRQAYPVAVERTHTLAQVRERWGHLETGEETQDVVGIGGRVVFIRNTGKLCFATLQEGFGPEVDGGRLQVMLSLAEIGEEALADWKSLVDLGDHVFVQGRVISSRRGELSVMGSRWEMAGKALRPMPVLHKELSEETRVRQRHVDLTVREKARELLRIRGAVTRSIRESLHADGYLEIESPVLQLVHGGAAARPFHTHLNAFDQPMTLRIALELYLKRAMIGGVDRVYEMGRIFRNEGVDSSHSPEFTMLEAYQAWGDQHTIADLTRRIIVDAADAVGSRQVEGEQGEINLDGDWRWITMYDALSEQIGEQITVETSRADLQRLADRHELEVNPAWVDGKIAIELFELLAEPTLQQPTFVCDYPEIAQPLARPHRSTPGLVEAWDLFIGGVERGTGFSELIDPVIQRARLEEQSLAAAQGDPEAMQLDEEFLAALEFGVPPMGGMGLGVDRLLMLLGGVGVRETILFPMLKPHI